MATVYKRGKIYWCAFFVPIANGQPKRIYRTTKQSSKKEAQDAARKMEQEHHNVLSGPKANKAYAILMEAAEQAAKGILTEPLVRKHLLKLGELSTGESMQTPSIREWFEGWLADKTRTRSGATAAAYRTTITGFLRSLSPSKLTSPLEALTSADFSKFRDQLQDHGRAIGTVNNALKVLGVPIKLAFEQGHLSSNPVKAVGRIERQHGELEARLGSDNTFATDQVAKLIAAASGSDWEGAIRFGYFTGLRLSDVANLRWKNVDLLERTVTLLIRKTKRCEVKCLHDDLHGWLMSQSVPVDPDAFLFPALANRGTGGRKGLSLEFAHLMATAGMKSPVRLRDGNAGHNRAVLSFHALRHTFNSLLANAGVSQEVRMKLTGHLSQAVNDRYTHHDQELLRMALSKVPSVN